MDEVQVDVEQVGLALGALPDDVLVPDLLGQRSCPMTFLLSSTSLTTVAVAQRSEPTYLHPMI